MKRRKARVGVLLLLLVTGGAIVNVAVAWGYSIRFESEPALYNFGLIDIRKSTGRLDLLEHNPFRGFVHGETLEANAFQAMLPTGSIFHESLPIPQIQRGESWRGWPLYALRFHLRTDIDSAQVSGRTTSIGATQFINGIGRLPMMPVWPGFAINTIFYAGVLWLLWTTLIVVRRRRRIKRGLCPACAYPVGTSPVCTECGKPVKGRNAEAQKAETA